MKVPKLFLHIIESNTRLIPILGILLLAIAVPLTLNLIEQNQDNRQQASEPISTQTTLVGTSPVTCAEIANSDCVREDNVNPHFTCFEVVKDGDNSLCGNPNTVCCIKPNPDAENSTCIAEGKSCDYIDLEDCEKKEGEGNCEIFTNLHCFNKNNCIEIKTSPTTTVTPTVTQSPGACEIAVDGKQYCCPAGSTKVGKTSDTSCALCQNQGENNRWSVAECSNLGGGPVSSCSADSDCESLPHSCSAQQTPVWQCVNNSTGTGKHCAHSCTSVTQ